VAAVSGSISSFFATSFVLTTLNSLIAPFLSRRTTALVVTPEDVKV